MDLKTNIVAVILTFILLVLSFFMYNEKYQKHRNYFIISYLLTFVIMCVYFLY